MTKERLEKYRWLQKEIAMLENMLYTGTGPEELVYDTVMSGAEFPYNKKPVVIAGAGDNKHPLYRDRLARKKAEAEAIEEFVAAIEDSTEWRLITWRYIEGKSVTETAQLMNYSESHILRMTKAFFEKIVDDNSK